MSLKKNIFMSGLLFFIAWPCFADLICHMITINDLKEKGAPRFEAFSAPTIPNLKPAGVDLKSPFFGQSPYGWSFME